MLLCCSRTRKMCCPGLQVFPKFVSETVFFDLERWETQSNQVAHEWWNLGSFVIVLSEFWYIECLAFRRNAVWDFWVLKVSAFGNLKPFLYDISYYVILYMCSILKWCCPCRICLHLHVNTVNTTRRIPMAQGFLHVSLWLGCFSLKDLILQHILEYCFPHLSSLSLVWVVADQGHTVECNPQATPYFSNEVDRWMTNSGILCAGLETPIGSMWYRGWWSIQ